MSLLLVGAVLGEEEELVNWVHGQQCQEHDPEVHDVLRGCVGKLALAKFADNEHLGGNAADQKPCLWSNALAVTVMERIREYRKKVS